MPLDESSPLLQFPGSNGSQTTIYGDLHDQFCNLSGVPPLNLPKAKRSKPHPESLYHRAVTHRRHQNAVYMFTATLTNTLLLSQVVLGATLTALGASDSSRILITVFGALNTVIAGLIAFLKSRGQPMRARMFRDDLERVVDEIENSAIMWLGISRNVHGYSAIDTDEQVTVRSEVARLTRLYDRAVKTNTMNDPDMYAAGAITDFHVAALKGVGKPGQAAAPAPAPAPVETPAPAPAPVAPVNDPDESPATKAAMKSPSIPAASKEAAPADDSKAAKPADSKPVDAPLDAKPADVKPAVGAPISDSIGESPATAAEPARSEQDVQGGAEKEDDKKAEAPPKDSMDPSGQSSGS